MYDALVFIGRFQPLHDGHLDTLRRALQKAGRVIVVLGSARRARNIKNPFSDDERRQMILAAVEHAQPGASARITICPVRDWYDTARWVAAVKRAVSTVTSERARIGIIGHAKDDSTYYLQEFPDWPWVPEENYAGLSATNLRRIYFNPDADAAHGLGGLVPPPIVAWLEAFRRRPEYSALVEEYAEVARGKAAWAAAPYPPVFVTVDALVTCCDHVLMVRRGGQPGRGQWALPGGFVDQNERLLAAALRELAEETGLELRARNGSGVPRGSAVFDHPDRSVRGRTITHAFHFALDARTLPAIAGGDDAAEARWLPRTGLAAMETEIFEDHLHIVDRFLHVIAD